MRPFTQRNGFFNSLGTGKQCHPIPLQGHLQLEQAALGQKVSTQNITAIPGGWTWPACLYFSTSADATERLQRHVCSSSKITGGREAPHSPSLAGAGSPPHPGITSTQKVSWQGTPDRQPHTPLQRQNTLKPPKKCTFVVLSLFAKTVSMTSCPQLELFSPCLGIL